MTDTEAEQRQIEQYLKQFCIEECLDEVLNAVLVDRPLNPYTAIASAIELKTLPELLDVHLYSVLHRSQFSVKAIVETNIGSFSGIAVYNEQPGIDELDEPKDYTAVEQSVREALVPLDPKNLKQIDEAIVAINNIDPAETLAISMAMCRAGAKFSGVKVNEHIATLAGLRRDEMVIPLPVLSVITREMGFVPAKQVIQLFPVKASDLEQAFNKLRQAVRAMSKCKRMQVPPKFDSSGTQFLDHTANLEEMLLVGSLQDFALPLALLSLSHACPACRSQRRCSTNTNSIRRSSLAFTGLPRSRSSWATRARSPPRTWWRITRSRPARTWSRGWLPCGKILMCAPWTTCWRPRIPQRCGP